MMGCRVLLDVVTVQLKGHDTDPGEVFRYPGANQMKLVQ